MKKLYLHVLSCSQSTVEQRRRGGARGTVFKEIRPGAGFETGDFVQEKSGGLP